MRNGKCAVDAWRVHVRVMGVTAVYALMTPNYWICYVCVCLNCVTVLCVCVCVLCVCVCCVCMMETRTHERDRARLDVCT